MPAYLQQRSARVGCRGLILCRWFYLFVLIVWSALMVSNIYSQDANTTSHLADRQQELRSNLDQLEKLMLKMADIDEATNPQRASLLREAVRNSRNLRVQSRMQETTDSLGEGQLKRASDQQTLIENDLRTLLRLLQSENRDEQLKDEEARIRGYIKSAQKLLNRQRSIQGRTEGGADPKPLSQEQGNLSDDAKRLADEIAEQEEGGRTKQPSEGTSPSADSEKPDPSEQQGKSPDSEESPAEQGDDQSDNAENPPSAEDPPSDSAEGENSDSDSSSGEEGEGKMRSASDDQQEEPSKESTEKPSSMDDPTEDEKAQKGQQPAGESGESEQSDPSQSETPENAQPSQQNQQPGQPSQEGQPSEGEQAQPGQEQQPSADEFSPRRRIEEAQRRMKEAQKKLDEADKEGALEDQQAAREELAQAIDELEEILRQLREGEIERVLARLEARFSKMLEMQLRVNDDTERLAQIPEEQWGSAEDAEAGKLSFAEKQIVAEADKALELLKEEGSSIAFPESLMQIRDDMQEVSSRLAQSKLDDLTIAIEEDIIAGLEELLESLKQAQQEQEKRQNQQQQQQQQQGSPGDEPLVDQIAELRLIKSMQIRVNQRTNRYAAMLDDADDEVGQAENDDLKAQLRELAERQNRIYDITRDNVQGKNQ